MLTYLRHATKLAHISIENILGLLGPNLNVEDYKRVLSLFYGFWNGWEPQIAVLLQDEVFLAPRRRLHLLTADLTAIGMSKRDLTALPLCPQVALRSSSEALGSLYVMEGSSLGGRVIQKNIERRLGGTGVASCAYFRGYGTETGAMWLAFLSRLGKAPTSDKEQIADGALATFRCLERWFASF